MQSIYEAFFFLKYAGGWSFSEAYNLPIGLRTWFIERLAQQIEQENEAMKESQNGGGNSQVLTPHNQPQLPPTLVPNKRQD